MGPRPTLVAPMPRCSPRELSPSSLVSAEHSPVVTMTNERSAAKVNTPNGQVYNPVCTPCLLSMSGKACNVAPGRKVCQECHLSRQKCHWGSKKKRGAVTIEGNPSPDRSTRLKRKASTSRATTTPPPPAKKPRTDKHRPPTRSEARREAKSQTRATCENLKQLLDDFEGHFIHIQWIQTTHREAVNSMDTLKRRFEDFVDDLESADSSASEASSSGEESVEEYVPRKEKKKAASEPTDEDAKGDVDEEADEEAADS